MNINNEYKFGDTVYLLTDRDQRTRMVTSFRILPGCLLYGLSCGEEVESFHYGIEISDTKNYQI